MKYLDILQNKINLSTEDFVLVKEEALKVFEKLEEKNVQFSEETFEITFCNHIASLIKRVIEKELVEELPEEFMNETSEKAKEISTYLVKDIFEKYDVELNKTEVFLVSTHIELTLMN